METPNSLVCKFESPNPRLRARLKRDPRIGTMTMQKARWFTFELSTDADLPDALDCLGQAYEAVGRK
jgi:hypothetical protein